MAVSERRAARSREIVAATRALFDERGVRDAQIEDIARAVGINRAIIYRHFSGKEELFAVTLLGYLRELDDALAAVDDPDLSPERRLEGITRAFFVYGIEHPAFVDCAQTLLRRRGSELFEEVSESVMVQLGAAMSACLTHVVSTLDAGIEAGQFEKNDSHLMANLLYASALGVLNLAHLQLSVRELDPGRPAADQISGDELLGPLVRSAVSIARGNA